MDKKRLFISDVHLGAGRYSKESKESKNKQYPYDWDWLSDSETANFESFIEFLRTDYKEEIGEIILLGDIFDNWIFPHDMVPPTMQDLLKAPKNKAVIKAMKRLSETIPVFYVPGNHDMHATQEMIKDFFPKFIYCQERFTAGRLVAEHGHRYAMFNAPPQYSNNIWNLPLGYFISRIEATRKALTNRDGRTYRTYVDDFIEMAGTQTMPQCVFEAVIEEAHLSETTQFTLKRNGGDAHQISATEVKRTYRDIYNDWPTHIVSKPRAVFAELDMLGPIADKLCKKENVSVCIFGHSHKGEIDKDTWFVKDRIYANSGFWCGSKCTFVETEKTNKGYKASLVKWLGNNKIKLLDKEII